MSNTLLIRPEARLIRSIGADLIKDYYAAVIELVKNAYDADSENVNIEISLVKAKLYEKEEEYLKFTIEDQGEGMSFDIIQNAWMVPATSYKLNKKTSTNGRLFQGRKGIGRYASAILGDYMQMETTDTSGETTFIEIDWKQFEAKSEEEIKYLDEIKIPYESEKTDLPSGTKIEIYSPVNINEDGEESINWSKNDYDNLLKELRNLLSPLEKNKDDKFIINLKYKNLEEYGFNDIEIEIEPFPLLELYDYRIKGTIDFTGKGTLTYENQNYKESNENIEFNIPISNTCGKLNIDLRFFDLEPDAIRSLIGRGLKDSITGNYLSQSEAKSMLKDYVGIGIYRNLFRIRPYGDSNFDWLELNQKRVNNPTLKFSTNQVVGFIGIESEEDSNLIEKSAREGLKENESYESLQNILEVIISEVESRRYAFRKNTKRGRKPANNIQEAIKNLFNFDEVSYKVKSLLEKSGLENTYIEQVETALKEEEKSKEKELKKIQDTLVLYEAHAALGKLVQLVIHEGRKPVQFIKDESSNMESDIEYFLKNPTANNIRIDILDSMKKNRENLEKISILFSKLDPLTAKRLKKKKEFNLCDSLEKNASFFKTTMKNENIDIKIKCNENINFYGREEDFFILDTNLIENSIYWLKKASKKAKEINIQLYTDKNNIIIDYKDNGYGIDDKFINEIFDAGFSTKPEGGTGVGLTLAGQAVSRNNGKIECIKNNDGTLFRVTFKREELDNGN